MARNNKNDKSDILDADERIELLRAFAFQVHRKRPLDEVLAEHIEHQLQLGRRREYRAANDLLESEGVAPTLKLLGLVGDEAAIVLSAVLDAKDHRLLSAALNGLAEFQEQEQG